jgi:hypothetical protein
MVVWISPGPTGESVDRFPPMSLAWVDSWGTKSHSRGTEIRELLQRGRAAAGSFPKIRVYENQNVCLCPAVPHSLEGRIAIVTDVERGMRWTCRVAARVFAPTNDPGMDAKACGPGLPTLRPSCAVTSRATTGARKPGSRGERAIRVKTIAQGGPGCFGQTCGDCRQLFCLLAGHGRGQRPAFPAPSFFRGRSAASPGRNLCGGNADAHPLLFDF